MVSSTPSGPGGPTDGSAPYTGWPKELNAPANRKKRAKKKRKPIHSPAISITSLTDMVTVLLVFLLKTFATNPVEVKDSSIEVPRSTCVPADKQDPDVPPADGCGTIEEATIVMITGPQQKRVVNGVQTQSLVTPRIVVDGKPVAQLDDKTYRVPDDIKDPATGNFVIVPLREALKRAREIKEVTAQVTGSKFDGKVIILADRQTPYRVLTDVLVTCGESGFADFRFAVIRPE
jgi:biopolymer transport protein ExbD